MHYNSTLIIGIVVVLYLTTWLLVKFKKLQLATHRKIWNVLMAAFFLISALLGLLMAISLDNKLSLSWYREVLWVHVELGIAMAVIAIFHFAWHLRYFAAALGGIWGKNNEPNNKIISRGKKLLWLGIPVLALVTYLIIMARGDSTNNDQNESKDTVIQSQDDQTADNEAVITNAATDDYDQLKVSSACIGCGRCVLTDPEHFAFDYSVRQAEVISESNLDSAKLDSAIRNCPARAIIRT
ncbi:MAG: ferredoxin [Patescibacteria group bacterium]